MIDKPARTIDGSYLNYIHSQSCIICGRRPVDADHLIARGRGSASQNDYSAIPLCREHHSERHQGGTSKLEAKYNVNLWKDSWSLLQTYVKVLRQDAEVEDGEEGF